MLRGNAIPVLEEERFARSPSEPHLAAWRRFNRVVGYKDGSVGFWHESYLIGSQGSEAVYGNMPVFGLAKATTHLPAVGRRETARARLGGHSEPAVSSPPQPDRSPASGILRGPPRTPSE